MPAIGGRVDVVGVDVEAHEAQGSKGGRAHDGHVVGGADADGRHVGARTAAHVRYRVLGINIHY